jgi:phosphatidylserine synthase
MPNPLKNSQIKANNIRIWVGVISLILIWALFIYKNLLSDLYLILVISFSLYTLFAYIVVPIQKNKKMKEEGTDE